MASQKIRIKLSAYDHELVDQAAQRMEAEDVASRARKPRAVREKAAKEGDSPQDAANAEQDAGAAAQDAGDAVETERDASGAEPDAAEEQTGE